MIAKILSPVISLEITSTQIDAIDKGESEPEASNDTQAGRELNRRVVIILDGNITQYLLYLT